MEIAAYSLRWENETPVVAPVTIEELENLPESIMETINMGCLCVYNGLLYGASEEHVLSDDGPMWKKNEYA